MMHDGMELMDTIPFLIRLVAEDLKANIIAKRQTFFFGRHSRHVNFTILSVSRLEFEHGLAMARVRYHYLGSIFAVHSFTEKV